ALSRPLAIIKPLSQENRTREGNSSRAGNRENQYHGGGSFKQNKKLPPGDISVIKKNSH
ncbi:unnamed protein product, partial [marine sediment metagenome]